MKNLSVAFGVVVAGIVVCFGMSVYTAIQEQQEKYPSAPQSIPTPAIGQ